MRIHQRLRWKSDCGRIILFCANIYFYLGNFWFLLSNFHQIFICCNHQFAFHQIICAFQNYVHLWIVVYGVILHLWIVVYDVILHLLIVLAHWLLNRFTTKVSFPVMMSFDHLIANCLHSCVHTFKVFKFSRYLSYICFEILEIHFIWIFSDCCGKFPPFIGISPTICSSFIIFIRMNFVVRVFFVSQFFLKNNLPPLITFFFFI